MAGRARSRTPSRRMAERDDCERVLIVCEGEKTEPNYFNEIKDHLKLNTANIKIHGTGASPLGIVNYAKNICEKMKNQQNPYDQIFCVFDRDNHSNYHAALKEIGTIHNFSSVNSVPCFEYWLLLHFKYTDKSYGTARQVVLDLKGCLPQYKKGAKNTFVTLKEKTEHAKENAKKALIAAQNTNTDNPSTRVHKLVDYLQNLKP